MAEIQLEEPATHSDASRKIYFFMGLAVGAVLGVVIGYYVNTGTLQYAYKLLSEAQTPPPDTYIRIFMPGHVALATPMGSTIQMSTFDINGNFKILDYSSNELLIKKDNYLYLYNGGERKGLVYVEGLIKGFLYNDRAYVVTRNGVMVYQLPDFVVEKEVKVEGINDAYLLKSNNPLLYILTSNKVFIYDLSLVKQNEFNIGGNKISVGTYYFFVWDGKSLMSYSRDNGREIASVSLNGGVVEMFACRGILLVLTGNSLLAYRVPDLSFVKSLNVQGSGMRADDYCTMVYVYGGPKSYLVLVPSLSVYEISKAITDVLIESGGSGLVAAATSGRKVALACGG